MTTPAPQYPPTTPQSFTAPPQAGVPSKRPGALLAAAILSMVLGVLSLISGILTMLDLQQTWGGAFNFQSVMLGTPSLLLGVAAIILGFVALGGSDFGRIFVAGVGGVGLFLGVSTVFNLLAFFTIHLELNRVSNTVLTDILYVLNGLLGVGILIALSSSSISEWSLARRGKAFPPASAMGPVGHPAPPPPGAQAPPAGAPAMGAPAPTVSPAAASPAPPAPAQPSPYASDNPNT